MDLSELVRRDLIRGLPTSLATTPDELGAIFAYLRTIPALKNKVPDPLPPPAASKPAKG